MNVDEEKTSSSIQQFSPEDELQPSDESPPSHVAKYHYVLLAFYTIFCYCGALGKLQVIAQYIYARYAEEVGLSKLSMNNSGSGCQANRSDPYYHLQNEAQARAANLDLFNNLMMFPRFFSVLFMGAYSDRLGRKLSIIIPWIGVSLDSIIQVLWVALDLPMYVYLLAQIPSSLSGGYGAMIAGVFSFLSDSTTPNQRSLALAVGDMGVMLSIFLTSLLNGWLIQIWGHKMPIYLMTGLMMVSGLFVFFLPETSREYLNRAKSRKVAAYNDEEVTNKNPDDSLTPWKIIQNIIKLFTFNRKRTQSLIFLFSIVVILLIYSGGLSINTLYLLNHPFCWNSMELGYYNAATVLINSVGSLSMITLSRGRFQEVWLIFIGLFFLMISNVVMGVSSLMSYPAFNFGIYGSILIGSLSGPCFAVVRSITSKMVTKYEIGALFGTFASLESLSGPVGGLTNSAIYKETVSTLPSAYKYFQTGIVFIALIVISIFIWREKRNAKPNAVTSPSLEISH